MSDQDIDPIEPKPLPPADNNIFSDSFESKMDSFFRADYRDLGARKWYTDFPRSLPLWSSTF